MNTIENAGITITELDPSVLLTEDNIRFGLQKYKVESLADNILQSGGINTPIEVEELEEPVNGKTHKVTFGFYRVAAATKLNKEGAGILVPAIIRSAGDALSRMKRQLSENLERADMSPMDKAFAMKRLLDSGVPKLEVRKIFATYGGRKGIVKQEASNSYVNMHLSFLEFPKDVQTKIHDGRIPVSSAYELTKYSKDRWEPILENAEAERLKRIERDEKDEEKFLAGAKKAEEAEEKAKAALKAIDDAKAESERLAKEAEAATEAKVKAYNDAAQAQANRKMTAEQKKAAAEAFKAADDAAKLKLKEAEKAHSEAEKLEEKRKEREAAIAARAAELKKVREEAEKKKKKAAQVSQGDIRKGAAATGKTAANSAKLGMAELRKIVDEWALVGSYPKVQKFAQVMQKVISGEFAGPEAYTHLTIITGEKKVK